jgi:hypothetical protein
MKWWDVTAWSVNTQRSRLPVTLEYKQHVEENPRMLSMTIHPVTKLDGATEEDVMPDDRYDEYGNRLAGIHPGEWTVAMNAKLKAACRLAVNQGKYRGAVTYKWKQISEADVAFAGRSPHAMRNHFTSDRFQAYFLAP